MDITIVIPNYNGKHFMDPCLDSLSRQTYSNFEIIVVDNNSSDGSREYMQENHPEIRYIQLDQNYGFSKAVNAGIKAARTPYIILLNNDTTVDSHFVEALRNAIRQSPKIFSVSSKMIQMYHPELIDSAGDLYTLMGWGVCRGSGRPVSNYQDDDEIFTACAGAAIYRKAIFEKIGYFDESHFAYLEDIDVGYRARIYGYKNMFCPSAKVYHVGSGTSGSKYNSFKVKLSSRNNIYLVYKNMPLLQLILNCIPLFMGFLLKYAFFIRIGFGKDYYQGIQEGLQSLSSQKKVPFRFSHLMNYLKIEKDLILYTLSYCKDWFTRKLLHR